MKDDDYDDCFDGLRLCSVCGDCYTTSDLCNSCRQQEMIDNDDLSWMDEPGYHTENDPLIDPDHLDSN